MSKTPAIMILSLALLGGMLWLLSSSDSKPSNAPVASQLQEGADDSSPTGEITLFCAASNQAVMEELRKAYEEETGRRVMIQYGPSQTLLSQIEVSGRGDLYLPADDSYLMQGREKGLIEEVLPIARMQAVVALRKDDAKKIKSFEDLLAPDVRLIQAMPDAAAIGKVTRRLLSEMGKWDQLEAATTAFRTTVTEVANDISVGSADAGIVYDAVLHPYPDLTFVELDELEEANSQISVGVIASTKQPAAALHFARYVSSIERGMKSYIKFGFRPEGTDAWSETPELSVFAGSMLRPAIEETIVAFEKREGVSISRVYNGCGILVGQMKAGQHPDAYFACDTEFMNQVSDLFPEPVNVSENELVILVQKGNPHQIASLKDLTKEGLRVGIGHEKQCAMGWITQNTFKEGGLQKEIMANVTVQTPTGDMLVNQLRTGSLDAAVVYLSNAAGSADVLDAVQIQGLPCSIATQPWAVAKESKYPELASRLFEKICSVESQDIFAAEGFRWQLSQKSTELPEAVATTP